MGCDEIRPQLELYVLGGLDAAAEAHVREHLAVCPDCREAEEACRLLAAAIRRSAPKAAVRRAFADSLQQTVAREIRAERHRRWARRIVLGVGSAAAAALLAVAVWQVWPSAAEIPPGPPRDVAPGPSARGLGRAEERWRHDGALAEPTSSADSVVVSGGSMYFLRKEADGERVAAIDLATGRPRWRSALRSIGHLAADASRVYCLAWAGPRRIELVALDASNGAVQWRSSQARPHPLVAPCRAVPVGEGRVAWVTHATVHLIDASTGRPLWKSTIEGDCPVSAVGGGGTRLFVVGPSSLHCLDAGSGAETWHVEVGPGEVGLRRPLLALAGQAAYLVHRPRAGGALLQSLDLRTRRVLWRRAVGEVRHILATSAGVYLRGTDVRAYHWQTGQPLWRRQAGGCSLMTAHDGLLYVVDSREDGRLLALNQRSGAEAWEMPGIRSCDAFRRVGRTGYVKTHDGVIHAIALRTP